jgi:hypothetical protein
MLRPPSLSLLPYVKSPSSLWTRSPSPRPSPPGEGEPFAVARDLGGDGLLIVAERRPGGFMGRVQVCKEQGASHEPRPPDAGPTMSDCQPRRDPRIRCSRLSADDPCMRRRSVVHLHLDLGIQAPVRNAQQPIRYHRACAGPKSAQTPAPRPAIAPLGNPSHAESLPSRC